MDKPLYRAKEQKDKAKFILVCVGEYNTQTIGFESLEAMLQFEIDEPYYEIIARTQVLDTHLVITDIIKQETKILL